MNAVSYLLPLSVGVGLCLGYWSAALGVTEGRVWAVGAARYVVDNCCLWGGVPAGCLRKDPKVVVVGSPVPMQYFHTSLFLFLHKLGRGLGAECPSVSFCSCFTCPEIQKLLVWCYPFCSLFWSKSRCGGKCLNTPQCHHTVHDCWFSSQFFAFNSVLQLLELPFSCYWVKSRIMCQFSFLFCHLSFYLASALLAHGDYRQLLLSSPGGS